MSTFDKKKKEMASKMGTIDLKNTSMDKLKRGNRLDNVGQNSHKKDSIKGVGSMKNSNRSMP